MQSGYAAREINNQAALRQNIPPNKNVVWRVKGGQSYNLQLNIGGGQCEADHVVTGANGLAPCFSDFSRSEGFEFEFFDELGADASPVSAGVDLSQNAFWLETKRRDGTNTNGPN